ncbi:hypothetical protein EVA_08892 [gut metagenome]|uniref:Uncharacterized protein n=1 Tax=gut metagenome TaxID=749906 RepID=J9G6W9_9ZZZZ
MKSCRFSITKLQLYLSKQDNIDIALQAVDSSCPY